MSNFLIDPYRFVAGVSLTDNLKLYYTMGDDGDQLNTASDVGSTDAIADSTVELFGSTTSGEAGHVSGVDSIGFPEHDVHGNYATSSNPASDYDFLVTDSSDTVWTICFWAKTECAGAGCAQDFWGLNGNGAGNDIQFRYGAPNNQFTIWFAGNEITTFGLSMTDTNWHFYTVQWDEPNGLASFQIDDGSMVTKTSITTSNTSSPPAPIRWGDVSGNEMEGYIQLFSVWNRILSADEITELWNSGAGREI